MVFLSKGRTFLFIGDSITEENWESPSKYPGNSQEKTKHLG